MSVLFDLGPLLGAPSPERDEFAALFAQLAAAAPGRVEALLAGERAAPPPRATTPDALVYAQTRRVIALDAPAGTRLAVSLGERLADRLLPPAPSRWLGQRRSGGIDRAQAEIDPALFGDWIWTRLFAGRVPLALRPAVLACRYRVPAAPRGEALRRARRHRPIRLHTDATAIVALADPEPLPDAFPWSPGRARLVLRCHGTPTPVPGDTLAVWTSAAAPGGVAIAPLPPAWQRRPNGDGDGYVRALLRGGAIDAATRHGLPLPPERDGPFELHCVRDTAALARLLATPSPVRRAVLLDVAPPAGSRLAAAIAGGELIALTGIELDDRLALHDASLTPAPTTDPRPLIAAWRALLRLD